MTINEKEELKGIYRRLKDAIPPPHTNGFANGVRKGKMELIEQLLKIDSGIKPERGIK